MTNLPDTNRLSEATVDFSASNSGSSPSVDEATLGTDPSGFSLNTTHTPAVDTGSVFGEYILESELARGGMGVVYKARQRSLNRTVAIKMILAGKLASSDDVKRFYVEAEAAARLEHPNIVPIYEIGEHAGQHFFSMGFVEGGSLDRLVADKTLDPATATRIMVAVCDAIQYAHDRGIVHRDLKPANILLTKAQTGSSASTPSMSQRPGSIKNKSNISNKQSDAPETEWIPKVSDFGLAKQLESTSDLTGTGQILGTPSYMPPEQASGDNAAIGPRSDVYSLGAILYRLLAGRPPFQASSPLETIMQVIKRDPVAIRPLNPLVPIDLETICLKCLQKEPNKRYDSAAALGADLQRWLNGDPIEARPMPRVERAIRWVKKHPGLSSSLAVACLGIAAVVAILTVSNASLKTQRDIALKAQTDADSQRQIAQTRLTQAIEAIDSIMKRASTERWSMSPEFQAERKAIIESAAQFYNSLIEAEADSEAVRWEAAKSLNLVAHALFMSNDMDRAKQATEKGLELCDRLIEASPQEAKYYAKKSDLLNLLGSASAVGTGSVTQGPETSLETMEQSIEWTRKALALKPDNPNYLMNVVDAIAYYAYFALSGPPEFKAKGKETLPEMMTGARKLVEIAAASSEARLTLAFALCVQSAYHLSEGNIPEASAGYEESKKIVDELKDKLQSQQRRTEHFYHVQAVANVNLGWCSFLGGKPSEDALQLIDQGIEQLQSLVRSHPKAYVYRLQLMQAYQTKSTGLAALGQPEKSQEAKALTNQVIKDLISENPDQPWLRSIGLVNESIELSRRVGKGDLTDFEKQADELLALARSSDKQTIHYNVACIFSVASRHVEGAERERYLDRAFEQIAALKQEGFFEVAKQVEMAKQDEDLQAVRETDRWKAFVPE